MTTTPDAPEGNDDEMIMDHMAMEAIHAVHNRDHESFRNSFHALVAHTLMGMTGSKEEE